MTAPAPSADLRAARRTSTAGEREVDDDDEEVLALIALLIAMEEL